MIAVPFCALLNTRPGLMRVSGATMMHNNARQRMQLRRDLIDGSGRLDGASDVPGIFRYVKEFFTRLPLTVCEKYEKFIENSETRETRRESRCLVSDYLENTAGRNLDGII